jgi:tRNA dimethylallyltransferase
VPEDWQPVLEIGINGDREDLRARLESRVHKMWQQGLIQEVKGLEPQGVRDGKTSSVAIGYAQALKQIDGDLTESEAIADTVRLSQKYARRQMSWFRRDPRIQWLDYQDPQATAKALAMVDEWLSL